MEKSEKRQARRLPVGADIVAGGGVHFRVWAPGRERVALLLEDGPGAGATEEIEPEPEGYFSGLVPHAAAGTRYRYRLDGEELRLPDPASRFQPDGPHGPSEVVDPDACAWTDDGWAGVAPERRVVYEMHIGTFTPEGTWASAARELPALVEVGVTVLEIMPVADFPGGFGWGYDGVNLFAPTRLYGRPDDFRAFVDRAHELGIGVSLDVVYNHLGPDGNYIGLFSDHYFTRRYHTDWGLPFNFDGRGSRPVREYILANVEHWIREYHLDGLRLDATQSIFDAAQDGPHILAEITRTARAAAGERTLFLIAENEPQETVNVRPLQAGGYGLDAVWNDDWHHSAIVALTGRSEAYYSDHLGAPQEFVSAAKYGFLYQGQHYRWQEKRRGTPALDLPPSVYVCFLQNHDQIANSARGERIHRLSSPAELRAMTALLLLGPSTPMLFQGQEFASSAPFLFFADHRRELAGSVERGRREFLEQFPSIAESDVHEDLEAPDAPETFLKCKLDPGERERHGEMVALHRDLLRLRHDDATLGTQRPGALDGAVLGGGAFVLRFFGEGSGGEGDRLLLVNLGRELTFSPAPEPLLAPPVRRCWAQRWSSEAPRYGGLGHPPPQDEEGRWHVPAHCAVLLIPESDEETR